MAKDDDTEEQRRALVSNGYDAQITQSLVARIELLQDEIDEINADAKTQCEPKREDILAIKKECVDAGLPRLELNKKLQERRLKRKLARLRDDLTSEQQDKFDNLSLALGELADSPLGQAALDRAAPRPAEAMAAHA